MVLHRPHELTTLRNLPSWALLAFAAGGVNAGALLACQRFVSHVTGTVSRIGVDAGQMLALDYLLVLVAFMTGAGCAIVFARKIGDATRPAYWAPLLFVATVLVGVAFAGHSGWFGPFGSTVETNGDFAMLAVLAFAMGMQNAAVAASTGLAVRTTHMTGPATDLGVAVAMLLTGSVEERAVARSSAVLRTTKLLAFIAGGVAMAILCPHLGYLAFLIPSVACLTATASSFAPWRVPAAA